MLAWVLNLGFAASGTASILVPDVVGDFEADAINELVSAGFSTTSSSAYSDTFAVGTVISQNPVGGSFASPGSTVAIVVSLGVQPSSGSGYVGGGGGGGFYPMREELVGKRRKRKTLSTLLDESLPEVYAELTRGSNLVVAEANAIVAPFESERAGIDWTRLEANTRAVGRLLALVAKQRSAERAAAERAALQRSDEDWFLMN